MSRKFPEEVVSPTASPRRPAKETSNNSSTSTASSLGGTLRGLFSHKAADDANLARKEWRLAVEREFRDTVGKMFSNSNSLFRIVGHQILCPKLYY